MLLLWLESGAGTGESLKPVDVRHVCCPHCGWSYVGVGTRDDEGALEALRRHLTAKHELSLSREELRKLLDDMKSS